MFNYVSTILNFNEYLDPEEQKPKDKKLPDINPQELKGALDQLIKSSDKLFKGDTRLPQTAQSKGDAPTKLAEPVKPAEPAVPAKQEHFSMF